MKPINEMEVEHNLLLEELNERIKYNIRKLGGFTKASKKAVYAPGMLNYYLRTDSIKTKFRTLKRLEELR